MAKTCCAHGSAKTLDTFVKTPVLLRIHPQNSRVSYRVYPAEDTSTHFSLGLRMQSSGSGCPKATSASTKPISETPFASTEAVADSGMINLCPAVPALSISSASGVTRVLQKIVKAMPD
jgi:hypothetical protein